MINFVKGLTYLYSHLHLDEWFLVRLLGQILELLGHGPVVTPLKYALSSCLFVKVLYTTIILNLTEIPFVPSLLQAGARVGWTLAQRPSRGPMRLPRREKGKWLVHASVCVMCRVRKVK